MPELSIRVNHHSAIRMIDDTIRSLEQPNVTYAVREGAKVIAQGIEARAPRRTGRLARSFTIRPISATEYQVASDLIYAPVHEFGAVIKPRRRTYLRFVVGGRVVFTKGPITIPKRPYVEPTFVEDGDKAAEAVMDRLERR